LQNYKKKVNAKKFDWLPEYINQRFPDQHPEPIVHMAVCQRLLFEKFSYHHSGYYSRRPNKMISSLSGDCQDHSVLLASMLKACGLQTAIVRTYKGEGHVFVEVKDPLEDIEKTTRHLKSLYTDLFDVNVEEISYENWRGSNWFLADTAADEGVGFTRHVGDLPAFGDENDGFLTRKVVETGSGRTLTADS